MKEDAADIVNNLTNLPTMLDVETFEAFIERYLQRKADRKRAIVELDGILANVQNHLHTLSMHIKLNYILERPTTSQVPVATPTMDEQKLYSKKEMAKKIGVDVKTISNYIKAGLKTHQYGRNVRITMSDLKEFSERQKELKAHSKSVVGQSTVV